MKKNLLKQLALVMAASILLTSADMTVFASENATVAETMDVSGNQISFGDVSECNVAEFTQDGADNYIIEDTVPVPLTRVETAIASEPLAHTHRRE